MWFFKIFFQISIYFIELWLIFCKFCSYERSELQIHKKSMFLLNWFSYNQKVLMVVALLGIWSWSVESFLVDKLIRFGWPANLEAWYMYNKRGERAGGGPCIAAMMAPQTFPVLSDVGRDDDTMKQCVGVPEIPSYMIRARRKYMRKCSRGQ